MSAAVDTHAALAATYADAHGIYRAAGWTGPLPLPASAKWPPPDGFTGWHGADPSYADSQTWIDDYPEYATTRQLALRMAPDVIGIDVDHYGDKRGGDTITEAERRWGTLPGAPRSSARLEPASGIRFYRVPAGTTLRTKIGFPELGLGGIEVIQRHHRYAVAWPSMHPTTGTLYVWHNTSGPNVPPRVAALNSLPDRWIEALRSTGEPGEAAADPETVRAFSRDHAAGGQLGAIRGVLTVFQRDAADGTRHDAMVAAACMAAREARGGRYPASDARAALREAFALALAEARPGQRLAGPPEARREFESIWAWAVGQALAEDEATLRARVTPRLVDVQPSEVAADRFFADDEATPEPQRGALNLPAEFWDARPSLKHIRDAALSCWACPDAVFGVVLARMSAFAHPGDYVDMGVGRSPLTLFAIPYGPPSAGKGVAVRTAAELLPVPRHLVDGEFRERPVGTGEGITESYFGVVSRPDPDTGKPVKVREQVRTNILFVMDEGETLVKLATRNGSTIATTIRRAWSGEMLGEANASAERDRQLDRGAYSMGLVVAFQPATIGPLFDPNEVGGGTPHRFLYMAADDDTLPEEPPEDLPSWPGPLELPERRDPALTVQWRTATPQAFTLTDREVRREIQLARWRGLSRSQQVEELDGHMNQMRGRIAAHLAHLDGRTDITGEDWRLAGTVVEVSNRVRDAAIGFGAQQRAAAARREDERHVRREIDVHAARTTLDERRESERFARGGAVLARKVLRDAPTDGFAGRALRDAAGRYKNDLAACLEYATARGWLVASEAKQGGTRYRVGPAIGDVPPA